jgi:hypothetical protein
MPRPASSGIDEIGVAPMRLSDSQPQTIRSHRGHDKVNMIGHETVRPNVDSGLARLLSEQIPVNLLIPVLKKDRLPTITALRNVMGKAGNHRAEGDRRKVPQ